MRISRWATVPLSNTNATGNMGLGIRALYSNPSGTNTMIGNEAGLRGTWLGNGNAGLPGRPGRNGFQTNSILIT